MVRFGELSDDEKKSFTDKVVKSQNAKQYNEDEQQIFIDDETIENKEDM